MVTSTEEEEDSHRQYAMQLVSASVLPMVLKAALELGVLDIIERAGPGALLSPSEIASHLPIHNNPDAPFTLDRILRLLASHSILTCSLVTHHDGKVHRLCGLAPVSKYFIPNQDGVSLAPFLHAIQDNVIVDTWNHLKDAVLEGGLPFRRTYGMDAIDYVGKDARLCEVSRASFRDYNPIFMNKILATCSGFEGLKSLVDVGGGNGINFHYGMLQEICFTSVPNGDAIFMKVMKSSFQLEFFSTNMKTDRKERTEAEFAKLGKEAGFSSTKVACCAYLGGGIP
ncbi:hypothetical protein PVL29_001759 [Vitis rotundifolia]|uniref:Caffeic acid O-methyltransferase n=1 Tax=Vitis rotundifolia TaxID=103349 RepID=A0AA39AHL3_VITRO|nr:hypothetical protein PVL29_001759 [Vitis rotundifolia]